MSCAALHPAAFNSAAPNQLMLDCLESFKHCGTESALVTCFGRRPVKLTATTWPSSSVVTPSHSPSGTSPLFQLRCRSAGHSSPSHSSYSLRSTDSSGFVTRAYTAIFNARYITSTMAQTDPDTENNTISS